MKSLFLIIINKHKTLRKITQKKLSNIIIEHKGEQSEIRFFGLYIALQICIFISYILSWK